MIENPNAERAMELADSLERRAKFARRIASNISRLGLPKDYRGGDPGYDAYCRLLENNRRLGIDPADTFNSANNGQICDPMSTVYSLAKAGCPLAEMLKEPIETSSGIQISLFLAQNVKRIVERLVTRTLTEKEYNGYLSGELPINENSSFSDPIYLKSSEPSTT